MTSSNASFAGRLRLRRQRQILGHGIHCVNALVAGKVVFRFVTYNGIAQPISSRLPAPVLVRTRCEITDYPILRELVDGETYTELVD